MNNQSEMDSRTISINLGEALIRRMDSRTRELDTDRSKYLRHLIRDDLDKVVSGRRKKGRALKA